MRRDFQPADWATFQVPIRFTKFDIRDYLYNVYNVEVKAVRSWVRRPVAPVKSDAGRWKRPHAEKFMTVEMTKPFVWPEVPQDLSPWDNELHSSREAASRREERNAIEKYKGRIPLESEQELKRDEEKYRTMAEELLSGKKKWDNGVVLDEKWTRLAKNVGKKAAPEVEKDESAEAGDKKLE